MNEPFEEELIEDMDFNEMDLDDEIPYEDEVPSLEELLRHAEELAEKFHLDDASAKEIRNMLICKYRSMECDDPDNWPYYNLLIRTNDVDQAHELAEYIGSLCYEIDRKDTGEINETYELTEGKLKPVNDNDSEVMKWKAQTERLFSESSCVCIYGCGDEPMIDVDLPSSSERQRNLNRVRMYKKCWEIVAECAENHHRCTLIPIIDESIYKRSFIDNKKITECICEHQVFVPEKTMDEVYTECLKNFMDFDTDAGFRKELRNYLDSEYPVTKLKKSDFIDKLVNSIKSRYFIEYSGEDTLTADMVPKAEGGLSTPEAILSRIDEMVGLDSVKREFREMYDSLSVGFGGDKLPHMVMEGEPGTGKTTVARMTADILFRMGVTRNNKLIETCPSDFVSEWRNTSGKKAREKLKEAAGGVLFIDEAYDFATDDNEGKKSALQVIMTGMEKDEALVIFAGYKDGMEAVMKTNPGLASRIRYTFEFEAYNTEELKKILCGMIEKDGFTVDAEAAQMLDPVISACRCRENFGNGRDMNNLWQNIRKKWCKDVCDTVNASERSNISKVICKKNLEDVMPEKTAQAINDMTGLKTVKEKLANFETYARFEQYMKKEGNPIPVSNRHMAFTGSPGTGKTTVAKALAQDLYNIGYLKTNKCMVVNGNDLARGYEPEKTVDDHISKSMGGILFIDEAYALYKSVNGMTVIEKLLTAMEDYKEDMIIILAGYTDEMKRLFETNPGLESRIGYTFEFEDYSLDELNEIFISKVGKAGFIIAEGTEEAVKELIDYFMDLPHFGNGRFVETVVNEVLQKRSRRSYDSSDANVITPEDIPSVAEFKTTVMDGTRMYDPEKIDPECHKRTAVHELGHALIALLMDDNYVPESISIRSRSSSYGRVTHPKGYCPEMTEEWCRNRVAMLMAGRNAEIMFFGQGSAGCSSDYKKAKELAGRMIKDYAMGEIGVTRKKDVLREACVRCDEMLAKYRGFIEIMTERLLEAKEISGEEMRKAFNEYCKEYEEPVGP